MKPTTLLLLCDNEQCATLTPFDEANEKYCMGESWIFTRI